MHLRTLHRAAASAAIVVIAVPVTAVLPGAMASAGERARSSLAIRVDKTEVRSGGDARVIGKLVAARQPAAGKTIVLKARPSGADGFTEVDEATTNEHGGVRFVVHPTETTRYKLRFPGDATTKPTHSAVATIRVSDRSPTSLSIRVAHTSIDPGQRDRIAGVLTGRGHPLPDRTIVLKQRQSKHDDWTKVDRARTNRHGKVVFTVHPEKTTHYKLRFKGDDRFRPTHSGVVTVIVRKPTTLSISTSTDHLAPGGSAVVSGVLQSEGSPLEAKTVRLRARAAGDDGFTTVDRDETASDGSVTFTVSPTSTTRYRLSFQQTKRYLGSRSPVIRIHVPAPSSLSIRASADSIAAGEAVVISGGLRGSGHPLADREVALQQRPTGSNPWVTLDTARTSDNGHVRFSVSPPAGDWRYRLVFAGGNNYLGCDSGVVTVNVTDNVVTAA